MRNLIVLALKALSKKKPPIKDVQKQGFDRAYRKWLTDKDSPGKLGPQTAFGYRAKIPTHWGKPWRKRLWNKSMKAKEYGKNEYPTASQVKFARKYKAEDIKRLRSLSRAR